MTAHFRCARLDVVTTVSSCAKSWRRLNTRSVRKKNGKWLGGHSERGERLPVSQRASQGESIQACGSCTHCPIGEAHYRHGARVPLTVAYVDAPIPRGLPAGVTQLRPHRRLTWPQS